MCSTTRGPAIWPSLVTWPTRITAAPERLAKRISSPAEPRTCVTVPGAASTRCVHMVWIESITRSRGVGPCDSVATISSTAVSAASSTAASAEAEPFGAQPHLRHGFLAGNIDGAMAGAGEGGGDLQQQRRFADAGIAAEQQHRAAHQAAAGHAVEFGHAGRRAAAPHGLALERLDREQPAFARRPRR